MFYRRPTSSAHRPRRGFTLIEASITTIIVGVGCVAVLELLTAGTLANNDGAELTTAMNLAANIRECMTGMRYADPTTPTHWGPEAGETNVKLFNDLDDFDGWTSSPNPPVDSGRNSLGSTFSTWTQVVKVESVKPTDLQTVMAHLSLPPDLRPTCRCTVTILHNNRQVYTQNWIACYSDPSAP